MTGTPLAPPPVTAGMAMPAPEQPARKKAIAVVKPKFDSALAALESLPLTFVGVTFTTAILGTLVYAFIALIGLSRFIDGGTVYMACFLIGLTLTPAAYFEIKKRAAARTAYHFHDSYLEFQDFRFYLIRRRGRIRYEDVRNVTQQASVLEGLCHMTTIYIHAPGAGFQSAGRFDGIRLQNLPDHLKLTQLVDDIIHRQKGA